MIQRYNEARFRVNGCDVWALLQVATNTAETQVGRIIRTAVLSPDDVVDLMGQNRSDLGKPTVLARFLSALLDQLTHID
jgi:hypothetical protein